MGFAARSVSLFRYRIKGELEGSFWDVVAEGVRKGAFREVESAGDIIATGWTYIEDFTDHSFEQAGYVRGNYVALSLRIDSVRIPSRILEIHFKKESVRLLQETGRKRLSSGQSRELKDRLKESLRHKAFPSIQVYDMVWNTSDGVVYLGQHSARARERFEDHFKKSFGLTLIPLIPYIRAQELLESDADRNRLDELTPCSFVP